MAMTPEDVDALPDFTTAQQLKIVRWRIAQIVGVSAGYTERMRAQKFPELAALMQREKDLIAQQDIEDTGENGGGMVLVQYGERV